MLLCDVPEGYGPEGDCDDTESEVSPDGVETCDGRDEDCDDMVDEDPIDPLTWYRDQDGDGFGDDSDVVQACDVPEGYTDVGGDCDDTDSGLALDCSEDGRAFIPEEEEEPAATEKGPAGCDCDSSGGRQGWAFIALAMLGGWRRRR
jgi:MYXO-CTERM domain-containing protein